jgi:hypothetical protein
MMRRAIAMIILIFASLIVSISASEQSAAVRGVLMCDGRPLANTKVKLYDDDR